MQYYGLLLHLALVRTDVSMERIVTIFKVTIIGKLGTLAVTNNGSIQRASVANYC
jgi:hypothetical protein